jgi:sialate O-acetylesterase
LCGARANSCHYVTASIDLDRAILDASKTQDATRVRYCWADSPVCNLSDESKLPVGPFELAIDAAAPE